MDATGAKNVLQQVQSAITALAHDIQRNLGIKLDGNDFSASTAALENLEKSLADVSNQEQQTQKTTDQVGEAMKRSEKQTR